MRLKFRLMLIAAGLLAAAQSHGAGITAVIRGANGAPVQDAVVVAVPAAGDRQAAAPEAEEVADQINNEFVPYVKPIYVGSRVRFPNKDNVRHHVYSFSPAKRFELPLYAGTPATPVLFDKPGVVVLGCNIHDWMIGYIYVSESPFYAKTGTDGNARLVDLPPGRYDVRVWHPHITGGEEATRRTIALAVDRTADVIVEITLRGPARIRRAPTAGQNSRY